MALAQDAADKYETGVRKYVGPVRVALQELDGQFFHNFQVQKCQHYIMAMDLLLPGSYTRLSCTLIK